MIIPEIESETINMESLNESNFGISTDDEGFVLEILRSKIYPHPINAVCREIASNGRDSHRENGNENVPIEIEIINGLSDEFNITNLINDETKIIFRDFGTGMTPKKVNEVLTKYGKSTRRKSDKYTGGYGLGSKTPFTYTDQFTVISRVDGIEYIFLAYIDESRKGKISLLNQIETNKPNGAEIIISLLKKDIERFEEACIYYTQFWNVRPKLIGFKSTYNRISGVRIDNFELVKGVDSSLFIVDGIPYNVEGYLDLKQHSIINRNKVKAYVYLENGDVSIPAHRETLQFDDETLEVISEISKHISEKTEQECQLLFNQCHNHIETYKLYFEILKDIPYSISFLSNLTDFEGVKLNYFNYELWVDRWTGTMVTLGSKENLIEKFEKDLSTTLITYGERIVKTVPKSKELVKYIDNRYNNHFHLIITNKKFLNILKEVYGSEKLVLLSELRKKTKTDLIPFEVYINKKRYNFEWDKKHKNVADFPKKFYLENDIPSYLEPFMLRKGEGVKIVRLGYNFAGNKRWEYEIEKTINSNKTTTFELKKQFFSGLKKFYKYYYYLKDYEELISYAPLLKGVINVNSKRYKNFDKKVKKYQKIIEIIRRNEHEFTPEEKNLENSKNMFRETLEKFYKNNPILSIVNISKLKESELEILKQYIKYE